MRTTTLFLCIFLAGCAFRRLIAADSGVNWVNHLDMKFVEIPAGGFVMGSPASEALRFDNEMAHPLSTIQLVGWICLHITRCLLQAQCVGLV